MNADEAFKAKVKIIIESASDPTTINGVNRLLLVAEEPSTTGNNGKIHGARTVKTPDINDTIKSAILFYMIKYIT